MSDEMTVPELREAFDRVTKDNTGLKTEVSDLTTKVRVGEAKEAFRNAGYNPANGALYAAINPDGDITAEAVVAFASEQGLPAVVTNQEVAPVTDDPTPKVEEGSTTLAPLAGSGSRAGDGGAGGAATETLTRQAWRELYDTDPSAAKAAVASGRVEISKDNFYAPGSGLVRGENPYAVSADPS